MQAANRLQKALKRGDTSYGAWQMLSGTNLTRTMCRAANNIDWLLVDLEHGNISDDGMHEIVAAAAACGVSPVVRVVEGQRWMIKRALDAGAHGILAPMIKTVEDAENVVRASKFPPEGERGLEPLLAVEKFVEQHPHGGPVIPLRGFQYFEQANSSLVIAVQIETKEALENVEAILAITGVDVVFIGPFDLSLSIGCPLVDVNNPDERLVRAMDSIRDAAKAAGKAVGIYLDTGLQGKEFALKGYDMINIQTDIVSLRKIFSQEFAEVRVNQVET
ncbi:2,4-dihydroxyhept-2-ene-1,7-dioic acid aldolase [Aaosphaeria arxii CBS 175.79]|uniref:2,4-dihydroxyhept-2-ene-1,7-dioic acid aldolase n=1 Tax=Aaosphaeria arxii CBS 175.79 TaxID=1450172 RepID=A0A6A5XFV9_9PLEO|nr:2,4-dihydroxyhept-2-ene-1,7-dioic acid aldolase [Aaosphaeria arxii CBS 175.79]KAF2011820.1 2,4-dihydroxyhept-2-ene-1,7-dioic acid aldolase [Aaosphaeria arxii CBS 175.79]